MAEFKESARLSLVAIFCVVGVSSEVSFSDEIFVYARDADLRVIAGIVVSISDGEVVFDSGCRGSLRRYVSDDYLAIHYNTKCRGSYRIDASVGDDDECGAVIGKGARTYQYVKTKNDGYYALKSVSPSGDMLRGTLLLSGRTKPIRRPSLDVYIPFNDDCAFRSMRN